VRYSLDQIDVFVACADTGSFSAAARRLGRSQSTISATIANLEAAFGTALFDRATKMPTLTDAGATLLIEARDLLDRALTVESHADSLAEGNPSRVTLALDVPYHLVMPVLRGFAARYPHVDVAIRNPVRGDVPQLLLDGEAELGLSFALPGYDRRIEFHQMGKLIMCHVAHRAHPLARQETVSFADLQAYRHLAHSKHSVVMPTTEYLQSVQTWYADSYVAVIAMLRGSLGWATVPRQLILDELERGELVDLQLAAYPHTDYLVGVDLLWARAVPHGAAIAWLRERLRAHKIFEHGTGGLPTTR
jgi:DNA-binding transcriptional LysR family regulator